VRECSAYYTYSTPHSQRAVVDTLHPNTLCRQCRHGTSIRPYNRSPEWYACPVADRYFRPYNFILSCRSLVRL
jgi:hypothetical protein